jgi:hypothetical protein
MALVVGTYKQARRDLDKNSFESNSRSLGYARKGGAMFVQWLLLL